MQAGCVSPICGAHRSCRFSAIYGNETEIGTVFASKLGDGEGKIPRGDVFVTSKLWNTEHAKDRVLPACKKTLKDLSLEYLDLYLIHWPFTMSQTEGGEWPIVRLGMPQHG